jgi:peptide/nickel transport system permease protein
VKVGKKTVLLLIALGALHAAVLLAGFLSPYDVAEQNRELPYAPPTRVHFVDATGMFHFRPSVCIYGSHPDTPDEYFENRLECYRMRFLVRGTQYQLLGFLKTNIRLFGVDAPAKVFLMGTDAYGRDVF